MIARLSCVSRRGVRATYRFSSPVFRFFPERTVSKQPFDQSTLEIPLGSGPYKVGRFQIGHSIEFDRVKDWWGANLPVARGLNNFDTIRYEYYRDREVGFEGFTATSARGGSTMPTSASNCEVADQRQESAAGSNVAGSKSRCAVARTRSPGAPSRSFWRGTARAPA